tara:strand:- start:1628 stop:2461 length:834 start_codon:yes stop_codon:yes gene_type:complete
MTTKDEFSYNPVTAIQEKNAPKEIAKIFADIRKTMGIPIVTSIWRGLANNDDILKTIWELTKPIYLTGEPEFIFYKMFEQINLQTPPPLNNKELKKYNLNKEDIKNIKNVLSVYNRSNTMNLIALSALIKVNFNYSINLSKKERSYLNIDLPSLLEKKDINNKTWSLIQKVNSYGASNGINSHVATLWRHLGYWPNFLTIINIKFKPLNENGIIEQSLDTILNYILHNGINLKPKLMKKNNLDKNSIKTITNYVHSKYQVVRMVAIGNMIKKWIEET